MSHSESDKVVSASDIRRIGNDAISDEPLFACRVQDATDSRDRVGNRCVAMNNNASSMIEASPVRVGRTSADEQCAAGRDNRREEQEAERYDSYEDTDDPLSHAFRNSVAGNTSTPKRYCCLICTLLSWGISQWRLASNSTDSLWEQRIKKRLKT